MNSLFRHVGAGAGPCVCLIAAMVAAAPAFARDKQFDALAAYGPEIAFDVYRDGKRIGEHRVAFKERGGVLTVESRFAIRVTVLGLPLYTYDYESTGTWRDGHLVRLRARTDDDGDVSAVEAERQDGKLKVHGGDIQSVAPGGIYPTTHWNPGVIGATQVLNTITGRINTVRMEDRGIENVATGDTHRPARHFAYTGELETEVWYDMSGRWVKMRFNGKDGTPIEYVCRRCGSDETRNSEGATTTAPETL